MKTETRNRDGKEEHKHVGYEWWHPVTRIHSASVINEMVHCNDTHGFFWSSVNRKVETLKKTMIHYENKVMSARTIDERLFWMGNIMKLMKIGFTPNYFYGGVE